MTIKTLEYIHRLLVEEEAKTNEVYKAARKLQHEYEESETADKSLAKEIGRASCRERVLSVV